MPTLLSDPPIAGLVTLGVLVLAAGGLWLRYRGKALLGIAAGLLVLLIVWIIFGVLFESPREEAVRRVKAMADAVTAKDWAKFGENVSESFAAKGRKKADLKAAFDEAGRYNAEATAWEFALTDPPRVSDTEVVIQFDAKGKLPTGEQLPRHFETTFGKDPDGKFRLKSYKAFDYVQKTKEVDFP
jgi:hypothetical protein